MENSEQVDTVKSIESNSKKPKSSDIFRGNPEEDSNNLSKVISHLKKVYGLPEDVLENISKTLKNVHSLEKQKEKVPANIASYVGNTGELPNDLKEVA